MSTFKLDSPDPEGDFDRAFAEYQRPRPNNPQSQPGFKVEVDDYHDIYRHYSNTVIEENPGKKLNGVPEVLGIALTGALRALTTGKYEGVQPRTTLQHTAALLRHLGRYMVDPGGKDDESGLPHLDHVLARAALLAFEQSRALDKPPGAL